MIAVGKLESGWHVREEVGTESSNGVRFYDTVFNVLWDTMIQSILPAFQTRLWENVLRYLCESFFRRVRKSNWRCIVAGVLAVGLAVSHICFYPWVINGLRGEQVLLVDQISEFDQFGARSTRTIVLATAPDTVGENTKNFSIYFWMNGWVCERVSAKKIVENPRGNESKRWYVANFIETDIGGSPELRCLFSPTYRLNNDDASFEDVYLIVKNSDEVTQRLEIKLYDSLIVEEATADTDEKQ